MPINYLCISGGGSDGAYGAGFLVGWTAKGTRPKFDVVTGISTGSHDRANGLPWAENTMPR